MNIKQLMEEEKKRSEAENASNGFGSFDPKDFGEKINLKLEDANDFRIVRLVGSFKRIYQCEIFDDEDKRRKPIIPSKEEGKDHPIWKANTIMGERDWDKATVGDDGKKKYPFKWAPKLPDLFNMVQHNNQEPFLYKGKSIENKGWYPSELLVWNALDRLPTNKFASDDKKREKPIGSFDYCKEEKKFKLISKDGFLIGVSFKAFYSEVEAMLAKYPSIAKEDDLLDCFGYDIQITKGSQQTQPYSITMADPRIAKYTPYLREGGLTEEERGYKLVDLEPITQFTPHSTIHKYLGGKLKRLFYAVGEDKYFEKWVKEVVEPEKEEFKKQKQSEEKDENKVYSTGHSLTQDEPAKEETPVRRRQAPISEGSKAEESLSDKLKRIYPNMHEEDYVWAESVSDDGHISWKAEAGTIYEWESAPEVKFKSPEKVKFDPLSGQKMQ